MLETLLDTDSSQRPCGGPDGYASLKAHPFFKGVDWENIRRQSPPKLALETKVYSCSGDEAQDPGWNLSHIGDGSFSFNDGSSGVAATSSSEASAHITRLPKKVMSFEDAKQRAWQWKKEIEAFQKK
ncbi:hypothetical protein MKX01_001786 [Papaver californicum]|nr:hypothetical protein MKX01_001786 [Papaver californicum]